MKRSNALNHKKATFDGATATKRLYQLRNSSVSLKKSPNTNKLLSRGAKAAAAAALSTKRPNAAPKSHSIGSDNAKFKATNPSKAVAGHSNTRSVTRALSATNSNGKVGRPKRKSIATPPQNGKVVERRSKMQKLDDDDAQAASNDRTDKSKQLSAASDTEKDDGRIRSRNRATKPLNSDSNNGNHGVGGENDHNNSKTVKTVASKTRISNSNNLNNNNNIDNEHSNNSVMPNEAKSEEVVNEDVVEAESADEQSPSGDESTKPKTKRSRTKRKYLCHFCNKEFLGGNDLRKHIRIHTDERPFECNHCQARFRQGGCLKNHIASQHGTTETFTCYYCNKSFPIKERLRLHMRLHSGEKPYQCKICSKRFARGGQLTQHLASHSGIKKYHCSICSASFSCSVNLKLHLKSHSNVRDFTCHMCGKSFIRPDALKKHLTCYHENVKAFFCHICSRTFKGHLPQHMRTHENVKSHGCADCGATFSQKSQLIVHQRIHSGERPYRCQVCWQAFAHSSVLKLHIRKHTGEKPFKCSMCKDMDTAFSQLPHLKTHMRAIHGMDKAYNCEFCSEYFKTKHELQEHKLKCPKLPKTQDEHDSGIDFAVQAAMETTNNRTKETSLSRMRLLIAVLLKKISSQDRLKQLGFDKRLIDNVLMDALKLAGQEVCIDTELHEAERLRANVKIFLDWMVPETYMKKFKSEQRTTEDVLEDLTSSFNREKAASTKA